MAFLEPGRDKFLSPDFVPCPPWVFAEMLISFPKISVNRRFCLVYRPVITIVYYRCGHPAEY